MSVSIRWRITSALAICLILIAATLSAVLYEQSKIDNEFLLADHILEDIKKVYKLQHKISSLLDGKEDFFSEQGGENEAQFNSRIHEIGLHLQSIGSELKLSEKETVLLYRLRKQYVFLLSIGKEITALSGKTRAKQRLPLFKDFGIAGHQITLLLEQLQLYHDYELEKAYYSATEKREKAQRGVIISGTILIILILAFGIHLIRSITRPINELLESTHELMHGDWSYRANIQTGDEFEVLARSFNGMAEKLSKKNVTLEEKLVSHSLELEERSEELETLLLASAELSAELDIDQLLKLMAQKLTSTLKVTYCRIALKDIEHADLVVRAAYPIRMLDWEPRIGQKLETKNCPDIQKAFDTARYVVVTHDSILNKQMAIELEQVFTPETQSGLVFPLIVKGRPEGVIILGEARLWDREPFSKEKITLCQTLINQSAIAIENAENYTSLHNLFLDTTTALSSAIDAKSHWTMGHSERMTMHAMRIGQQLSLDADSLDLLRIGCTLHDIGKIATYEQILNKVEPLTDEEIKTIQQHPIKGEAILKSIHKFKSILPIVRSHHEKYDGTGYPDGLKGDDIPLLARIAALADTYDAMTADRPYRKGCSHARAIDEIKRCSGTQFDPEIAAAFVTILENDY